MVMLYEMLCKKLFYVKLEANDLNTEAKGQDEQYIEITVCFQLFGNTTMPANIVNSESLT
mgnify:CR=1 FL=1